MADSKSYYEEYKKKKELAEEYADNIASLQKIKDKLTGSFYDEQKNVNGEIDDLQEDLEKAIRHNTTFERNAGKIDDYDEVCTTADKNLSGAVTNIEDEISDLSKKRSTAEQERDDLYKKYEDAKAAEWQEFLKKLKGEE